MARHHPRAPKLMVSLEKVCKGILHLRKERSILVNRGKQLKETRLGVGLSEQLKLSQRRCRDHGDALISSFDKQITVSSFLVCLSCCSLVLTCVSTLYSVVCLIRVVQWILCAFIIEHI
jgi:hypothetical protein